MPAEPIDASPTQRILPGLRVRVRQRSAPEREYAITMFADLFAQHGDGFVVQGHSDRGATFGFIGMNPCGAAFLVDIRPAHAEHVGLAQSGCESETRELSLV